MINDQDVALYPHTNNDLLAVGELLTESIRGNQRILPNRYFDASPTASVTAPV